MTYALRFVPGVEGDADGVRDIQQNPLLYPKVYGAFRRRLLGKFPYAIYFRIVGSKVVVFGLFHCAGAPVRAERR